MNDGPAERLRQRLEEESDQPGRIKVERGPDDHPNVFIITWPDGHRSTISEEQLYRQYPKSAPYILGDDNE